MLPDEQRGGLPQKKRSHHRERNSNPIKTLLITIGISALDPYGQV